MASSALHISCWRPVLGAARSAAAVRGSSLAHRGAVRSWSTAPWLSPPSAALQQLQLQQRVLPRAAASAALFYCPARGLKDRSRGVKSSIRKRFRVKPSGAITRLQCGKRHLLLTKSRKRVNALGGMAPIYGAGERHKYVRLLRVSPLR